MSKRAFGEPIKEYIIEEDRLLRLLEIEHRYNFEQMESGDQRDYFYRMMCESCDVHSLTYNEFKEAIENMTFESLAEMDLELYEERGGR